MHIIEGWLTSAERIPSPNFNERPAHRSPSLLVIHNISLPPGQYGGGYVERFFQNSLDSTEHPFFEEIKALQVSSHFFIRRNGDIVQFVSTDERAWHAGVSEFQGEDNCNDFSLGIELEGTDTDPYEPAQYQSLTKLTKALMAAYPLITTERIAGHSDIAPDRKTDPGPAFSWAEYRSALIKNEL
ncbi:1,6-anhydro-N-acetylmuramyl-L-alanine amidase AmpD [Litoribacillus peritrichatus]|uniref:1,6-anhydro-N-acetylmuramyl-L-alanine amidase AmpD n=1 Tax=Litoribacillus peritrichatus TaxID=718191 RepID=A0ABP7M0W9_9GAMM